MRARLRLLPRPLPNPFRASVVVDAERRELVRRLVSWFDVVAEAVVVEAAAAAAARAPAVALRAGPTLTLETFITLSLSLTVRAGLRRRCRDDLRPIAAHVSEHRR